MKNEDEVRKYYTRYKSLIREKDILNEDYNFWFIHDTEEGKTKVEEISNKLKEINNELSGFDINLIRMAEEYFSLFEKPLTLPKANDIVQNNRQLKEPIPVTFEEDKDNSLSYTIVNRTAKFRENTCQRFESTKSIIVQTTKDIISGIKAPFDKLREKSSDAKREDLRTATSMAKEEALQKEAALRRVRTKEEGGYVLMGSLIVVATIAIAIVIFTVIGNILG